ncbi:DNA polymerase III subunit chi [Stutzerimonas tarimensis]|uniref:DNA polymerase III subunit chi n=1 Tax=Stutzerimonas tarimensis TaxID=1507735 RepID=A0ABV7T7D1_9GAMM
MTRIEFYVLPDADPKGRLLAACRLASKAWQHELPVFVRCQDERECGELDALLWSFRGERFIPHNLHDEDPMAPVVIGLDQPPAQPQAVLINLAQDLSGHLDRYSRVFEIVNQEPHQLARSRENFRVYRRQGYDPKRVEL